MGKIYALYLPVAAAPSVLQTNIFFSVPRNTKWRKAWYTIIEKQNVPSGKAHFCCEDHFLMRKDPANRLKFELMKGAVLKLKDDVVPQEFNKG